MTEINKYGTGQYNHWVSIERENLTMSLLEAVQGKKYTEYYDIFITADLETTGLDCDIHGIVEFGAHVSDKNGKTIDAFSDYCDPGDVIFDPKALAVNGLTVEFIKKQKPIEYVGLQFILFLNKYIDVSNKNARSVIIGNNFSFDLGFLNKQLKQPYFKHIDANITRWIFRRTWDLKGYVMAVRPDLPLMSQEKLGEMFGISNDRQHGAAGDTKQLTGIIHALRASNLNIKHD